MKSKLRARTPIIALALIGIAVLFIASCSTNEVEIPGLTGPSGSRLFITIEASPDKVFIRTPNKNPNISRITLQLKNQLGEGVPNARIAVRITNVEGSEVGIGDLDHLTVVTDAGGFARLTYTAPSTAEQPVPVTVFIRAILTDPAFAFEVVSTHALDLQLAKDFECVGGPGSPDIDFTFTPTNPAEDQEVCFDAQGTTDNGAIISFSWSFGDGGTDTGVIACHTFRSQGAFPVTLTVVDGDQNCVSITQFVNVGEGGSPTCSFTASPNPVNTDTNVTFNASASQDPDGNIVSYNWNFGDGSTRNGEIVTHSFSDEGSFVVTLIVRDNAGNETTCTQTVTVSSGLPTCDFSFNPASPSTGDTVTFDGTASSDVDGGTLTFAWDLDGDGAFDDGSDPVVTHVYDTQGTFLVQLRITDDEENSVVCAQSITVGAGEPPTCSFTASPTSADVGDTVNFNATASDDPDGTITTFEFDFGDGTSSPDPNTDPTVSHVYTANGTFVVTLTLTDDDGNTTSCTRNVTIGNALPLCTFSATPNSGTPPLDVNFNASASTDQDEGGSSIVSFAWDFGDGNVETNAIATTSHTFTTVGEFEVELTVTDDEGGTETCTRTITTTGAVPTAAFTVAPNPGTAGVQSTFDASTSTDNDEGGASITEYRWDFGDGSPTVITNNPVTPHTFAAPGNYSVTLTVVDDEDQLDTENLVYTVN